MTKIKFCGMKTLDDIFAANEIFPEYVGFVFASKSKRYITPAQAEKFRAALSKKILAVGVFVNEKISTVAELLNNGIIDAAQLHGNEDNAYIKNLRRLTNKTVIQAFQFDCALRITHYALKLPPTISLDAVSFTYPKKKSPVLQGVTLKFSAGKVTALTGTSGAGKSTLLKLLAGLLKPDSGKIIPNSSFLIPNCSYAPQAPHLFETTLEKNFTMFDTLDGKPLKKFLSALNLSTLNLNAPQKLSRGQLQRLGLIRALLKDSPIILLDEPTAGLDEATEQKVLTLIKEISPRKTIIIATHRLAVIEFADEVQSLN